MSGAKKRKARIWVYAIFILTLILSGLYIKGDLKLKFIESSSKIEPIKYGDAIATKAEKEIIIFSSNWCGSCESIKKELLNNLDIDENTVVIEATDEDYRELFKNEESYNIPAVLVKKGDQEVLYKTVDFDDIDTISSAAEAL